MGTVYFVQFGDRPKITGVEYEAAAVRLEREAVRQPDVTARQLRRLATSFRVRATEGAG
jgi:hypothetical protein